MASTTLPEAGGPHPPAATGGAGGPYDARERSMPGTRCVSTPRETPALVLWAAQQITRQHQPPPLVEIREPMSKQPILVPIGTARCPQCRADGCDLLQWAQHVTDPCVRRPADTDRPRHPNNAPASAVVAPGRA